MKNNIAKRTVCVLVVLLTLAGVIPPSYAESRAVIIASKEDFAEFAKKCTLDTYSADKSVSLICDVDFSGSEFVPVPSFCGEFNGNGYTISGIELDAKGSYQGVFRYIYVQGRVSNLNVKGSIAPEGSKSFVGGIAGENNGTIENCTFDGSVKGENVIGGIAGSNKENGRIIQCSTYGSVSGENSTGGICGKNSGFIQNCTNNATVNTVYVEKKTDITDIDTDTGAIIENGKNFQKENMEESILGHSDTGGIVGFSDGIVQGCENNASVGYQHIGYNVGGIAGRQYGYILGCNNYGKIQGRKDVGGIAGQAEPYILLDASELSLKNLRAELDKLNQMVNRFITDTDDLGDGVRLHLDGISDYAEKARENTEELLRLGADFTDDNLSEINAQAAILSDTLDKLSEAFDTFGDGVAEVSDALDMLNDTLSGVDVYIPDLKELDGVLAALSDILQAEKSIKRAVVRLQRAEENLERAINFKSSAQVKKAISDMSSAINDIITAKITIGENADEIESILNSKPNSFDELGINAKKIAACLKNIKNSNRTIIRSLQTVNTSIELIAANTELDYAEFKLAAKNINAAIDNMCDAAHTVAEGIEDLRGAIRMLPEYDESIDDEIKDFQNGLSDSINALSYAVDDIALSVDSIKTIIEDLSNEEPLEFTKLGDETRETGRNVFDAVSGISDELNGLKTVIYDKGDKLSGDLTSISNQFNLIMNHMIGEIEEINGFKLSDRIVDVSDENIESIKQGKIEGCNNSGDISADRNAGGIVGAMAIEYSKDPEDDIEKPDGINFSYRSRAILQGCINEGEITGKKHCIGGIVGNAEIGAVNKCENYGNAESTGGNYVGGIAGKSDSAIRKSYSKATLSGKKYVGGIAGEANTVTSSYSIVRVNGEENTGAMCGICENREKLYHNYYIDNDLGAIDGISYKDRAEAIEYDKLREINDIPPRFISFSVAFIADGKTVEKYEMKYGEEADRIKYPPVPEKEGCFGRWIKPENDRINENIEILCEYKPYVTVIGSDAKNETGKLSVALVEGEFTDKDTLVIKDSEQAPPVRDANVYDITVKTENKAGNSTLGLRLLNEKKDKATVWLLKDGKWEKVKSESRGKYVRLQVEGCENTVCVKYERASGGALRIILICAFACCAVLAFVKFKKRNKA